MLRTMPLITDVKLTLGIRFSMNEESDAEAEVATQSADHYDTLTIPLPNNTGRTGA